MFQKIKRKFIQKNDISKLDKQLDKKKAVLSFKTK